VSASFSSFERRRYVDVLEHIQDDDAALAQVYLGFSSGRNCYHEVPAGHLYDAYDKALKHFRRYEMGELGKIAESRFFQSNGNLILAFFSYRLSPLSNAATSDVMTTARSKRTGEDTSVHYVLKRIAQTCRRHREALGKCFPTDRCAC